MKVYEVKYWEGDVQPDKYGYYSEDDAIFVGLFTTKEMAEAALKEAVEGYKEEYKPKKVSVRCLIVHTERKKQIK